MADLNEVVRAIRIIRDQIQDAMDEASAANTFDTGKIHQILQGAMKDSARLNVELMREVEDANRNHQP